MSPCGFSQLPFMSSSTVSTFALAQLSQRQAASSPEVILNLKISSGNEYLAAATSYGDLCHLDPETLQVLNRFRAHRERIVDLNFVQPTTGGIQAPSKREKGNRSLGSFGPSILCSVGSEGLVAWWDLRLSCKAPALKIQSKRVLKERECVYIYLSMFLCLCVCIHCVSRCYPSS